jgi:tetratricopeptide (TPR) repeat protein
MDTALDYHKRALVIREKELGTEHPITCMSYTNIAGIYHMTGHIEPALIHYEYVLKALKKTYQKDEHPDIATVINNMASCYSEQEDLDKKLALYRTAMNMRKKLLGEDHPDTLSSCNSLSTVMRQMGDCKGALNLQKRILKIRQELFGEKHPDTALSYNSIASTYYYMGNFAESLEHFVASLKITVALYGAEHPETQMVQDNIRTAYKGAKEAEPNNHPLSFDEWIIEVLK